MSDIRNDRLPGPLQARAAALAAQPARDVAAARTPSRAIAALLAWRARLSQALPQTGDGWRRSDLVNLLPALVILALGLCLFGADRADIALVMDVAWGANLLVAMYRGNLGTRPFRFTSFRLICALYGGLSLFLLASVTPLWSTPWPNAPAQLLAPFGTIDRTATLVQIANILGLGCAFLSGLSIGRSDRRAERMMIALCLFGSVYSALALMSFVFKAATGANAPDARLAGSFLSSNVAAGFFIIIGALLLCNLDAMVSRAKKAKSSDLALVVNYAGLLLVLSCLVLTASRMGAVTAVVAFLSLPVLRMTTRSRSRQGWLALWPYAAAAAVFIGLVSAGQALLDRFSMIGADFDGRTTLMLLHWRAFIDHPFAGYGLGTFPALNKILTSPENFSKIWNVRATHNVYLQWLEEAGLPGFLLISAVITLVIREIVQGHGQRKSSGWLLRAVLASSIALLLQGLVDFSLQTPGIALFWSMLLGMGYAVAIGGSRTPPLPEPAEDAITTRAKTWAPAAWALTTGAASLVILWGTSLKAVEQRFPLVMHSAYDEAALRRLSEGAGEKGGERDAKVRELLRRSLNEAPANAYAWTLMSSLAPGSDDSIAAFNRSYLAAPLDSTLVKWRLAFAAKWWDRLPPGTKERVISDAVAEAKTFWDLRAWLAALSDHYKDTPFGLSLRLALLNEGLAQPLPTPAPAQAADGGGGR